LSEQALLGSLKDWDPEIAAAVENSVLKSDFELYFYRKLTPNQIRETSGQKITSVDDQWIYNPENSKHAFLWFKNLPEGWSGVLDYEALRKGRFGQSLYKVKVDDTILKKSYYSLGDEFESSERRNISNSGSFDPTWTKEYIKLAMQSLYEDLGEKFSVPADGERFGTFPLADRRGLMLYMFLTMERYSRQQGVNSGLSQTGYLKMPFGSWIDVNMKTELILDQNVEAMEFEVDVPKDAFTGKWTPIYIRRQKSGPYPDQNDYQRMQKRYDSKRYGIPN